MNDDEWQKNDVCEGRGQRRRKGERTNYCQVLVKDDQSDVVISHMTPKTTNYIPLFAHKNIMRNPHNTKKHR